MKREGGSDPESRTSGTSADKILRAAVQVAIRDGIMAMTLDAVSHEASVSKGGLLYHFRSKDELIAAMLVHFKTQVQAQLGAETARDPNPRGRLIRAMLNMVFPERGATDAGAPTRSEMSRFMMAILVAAVNNPRLLDPVCRSAQEMRQCLLAEGRNGLRQIALRAAVDGLLLWEHLGLISPDDPLFESILDELHNLALGPDPSDSKERSCHDDSHISGCHSAANRAE
jgi:AcrR family transcriptional regulator